MLKCLRIAVTVLGLLTCVLTVALWIRSHSWADNVYVHYYADQFAHFASEEGVCAFMLREGGTELSGVELDSWSLEHLGNCKHGPFDRKSSTWLGFDAYWFRATDCGILAPHWFVASLLAIVGAAPWIRSYKRFSLRTLLIATTLVAVALGTIVQSS